MRVRVNAADLERRLRELGQRAKAINIEGIVAEDIVSKIDDLVDSEGNGTWPGFSPVTLKLHPRRAGGMLLQRTGQLLRLQKMTYPGYAEVSSPAPYAAYQQEGTRRLRGWVRSDDHGIPPRDFMAIDIEDTLEGVCKLVTKDLTA